MISTTVAGTKRRTALARTVQDADGVAPTVACNLEPIAEPGNR